MTEQITNVMATQWVRGSDWAIAHARTFRDEVRARVDAGVAACADERVRLMWVGAGLWHDTDFYTAFEESHGAVFVWSMYLAFGPDGYIRYGLDDPLAALASRIVKLQRAAAQPAVGQRVDRRSGAAASHRRRARAAPGGMRPAATGKRFVERALEHAGIPVLTVDADVVDARGLGSAAARESGRSFLDDRVLQGARRPPTLSPNEWLLPFGATLAAMFCAADVESRVLAAAAVDAADLGMSFSQLGFFAGMYGLLAMVLSVPAGLTAKRFGEKRALAAGLVVVAIGSVLLSRAGVVRGGARVARLWIIGYRFAFVCVFVAVSLTARRGSRAEPWAWSARRRRSPRSSARRSAARSTASSAGASAMLGYAATALIGATVFWLFYRVTAEPDVCVTQPSADSTVQLRAAPFAHPSSGCWR